MAVRTVAASTSSCPLGVGRAVRCARGAAERSSLSRDQLSRVVPTVFHIATICSTGAKALLARIEAASMPPGVSSRSSTSQAPSPITPLCTTRRTNRVRPVMAPPRSAAAWVRASAVPPRCTSRAVSVSSMPRPEMASRRRCSASARLVACCWLWPASRKGRFVARSLAIASTASSSVLAPTNAARSGCRTQMMASASGSQGASNRAVITGPIRAWRRLARSRTAWAAAPLRYAASTAAGKSRVSNPAAIRDRRQVRTQSRTPMTTSAMAAARLSSASVSTRPEPSTRS